MVSRVMSRTFASRGALAGGAGSCWWQPAKQSTRLAQSAMAGRILELRHRNPWFGKSRILGGVFYIERPHHDGPISAGCGWAMA